VELKEARNYRQAEWLSLGAFSVVLLMLIAIIFNMYETEVIFSNQISLLAFVILTISFPIGIFKHKTRLTSMISSFSLIISWFYIVLIGSEYTLLSFRSFSFIFYLCMILSTISGISLYKFGVIRHSEYSPSDVFSFVASLLGNFGILILILVNFVQSKSFSFLEMKYFVFIIAPLILLISSFLFSKTSQVIFNISFIISNVVLMNDFYESSIWTTPSLQSAPTILMFQSFVFMSVMLSLLGIVRIVVNQIRGTSEETVLPIMHPDTLAIPDLTETKIEDAVSVPSAADEPAQDILSDSYLQISSGYDIAGENLKLAVKVENEAQLAIMNVIVNVDVPDGFEFVRGSLPSQKLGNIPGGGFQSAIFWLRPLRCIDDEYGGSIIFRDATNKTHSSVIPRKRIVNICPMLGPTEHIDDVFKKLKFGSLKRNCASFKFKGLPNTAFALAEARLKGLKSVDKSEQEYPDGSYLGYACYIGETKFGTKQFATEIQASGLEGAGILTLTVYSDDERILSGFFADIMPEVREHIQVFEEQVCQVATCPKCGAGIDPSKIDESRVYRCAYCSAIIKVPPWIV